MTTVLSVSNLNVSFGGLEALNLNSFELKDKELRVIIGPNGAGKSTFMDVLCGKTEPNGGSALFNGIELIGKSDIEITRMGIGRKFQKPSIFEGLTVFENLMIGLKGKKGFYSSLFFKLTSEQLDRIHEVAERVSLEDELHYSAALLSHGKKQWLEIAIVLLQDPELMLIDEPTAGMSDFEATKTGELLCELAEDSGIIVIEHDMHFVEQIAREKVTVLVHGEVLIEGSFKEVKNNQKVIECYLSSPNSAQTARIRK